MFVDSTGIAGNSTTVGIEGYSAGSITFWPYPSYCGSDDNTHKAVKIIRMLMDKMLMDEIAEVL